MADLYGGISPYSFGFNSPTNFNDPTGLSPLGDFLNKVIFIPAPAWTIWGQDNLGLGPPMGLNITYGSIAMTLGRVAGNFAINAGFNQLEKRTTNSIVQASKGTWNIEKINKLLTNAVDFDKSEKDGPRACLNHFAEGCGILYDMNPSDFQIEGSDMESIMKPIDALGKLGNKFSSIPYDKNGVEVRAKDYTSINTSSTSLGIASMAVLNSNFDKDGLGFNVFAVGPGEMYHSTFLIVEGRGNGIWNFYIAHNHGVLKFIQENVPGPRNFLSQGKVNREFVDDFYKGYVSAAGETYSDLPPNGYNKPKASIRTTLIKLLPK